MDFEVVWAEPAVADLESVLAFAAVRNAKAADSLRIEILGHVEAVEILTTWHGTRSEPKIPG